MTDLHKPLGQDQSKTAARSYGRVFPIVALTLLVGAGALLYVQRSGPDTVVVALDGAEQEIVSPAIAEKPAGVDGYEPKDQQVSTTEPEPAPKPVEQPSFTPKQGVVNRQKAWLPVSELVEDTDFGPLPKIATSGLRPLDAYSERPNGLGKTRIAIVLGGMGLSQTGTKNAIETLPSGVTFAFSPMGNSLNRWMQLARKEGHEVALQIPMEPLGYPSVDPGRFTLLKESGADQNITKLRSALGRMTNYPFVVSYLGAGFSNDKDALEPVLQELRDRGLGWLDNGAVPASKSLDVADGLRLPNAAGNLIIDGRRQASRIATQLQGLELLANRRGFAIGSGTAFPETVKALSAWVREAEKKGIQLVPVSHFMKDYSR